MLTAKQESYCKCRALEGKSQIDSYKASYDAENMGDDTIYVKACLIEKKDKIRVRIQELKAKIEAETIKRFVKTKEDLLNEMELLKAECTESEKKIKLDAIKEQGKLLGYYVERKEIKDTSQHEEWLELMKKE